MIANILVHETCLADSTISKDDDLDVIVSGTSSEGRITVLRTLRRTFFRDAILLKRYPQEALIPHKHLF